MSTQWWTDVIQSVSIFVVATAALLNAISTAIHNRRDRK